MISVFVHLRFSATMISPHREPGLQEIRINYLPANYVTWDTFLLHAYPMLQQKWNLGELTFYLLRWMTSDSIWGVYLGSCGKKNLGLSMLSRRVWTSRGIKGGQGEAIHGDAVRQTVWRTAGAETDLIQCRTNVADVDPVLEQTWARAIPGTN